MSVFWTIIIILISVFVLFFIIFLFMDVNLVITFKKPREGKCNLNAQISLPGGKVLYDKNLGNKSEDEKEETQKDSRNDDESFKEEIRDFYDSFLAIKNTYKKSKSKLKKAVLMEKLEINASFGLEDAFATAMATGAVWTGIFGIVAFLTTFMIVTEPAISIKPDFDEQYIEVDGECRLKLKVISFIGVLLTLSDNYNKVKIMKKNDEKAAINYGSKSN